MAKNVMAKLLGLLLPVHGRERQQALTAFMLFGLLMFTYYVFKPVRSSLAIHYLGSHNLPYVYLLSGLTAGTAMYAYNRLLAKVSPHQILQWMVIALSACALFFWVAHASAWGTPALQAWVFSQWVALYGAFVSTIFWSLSNDVFSTETTKKVFGFIGAGGIVGAALGGIATEHLVELRLLKTESLLLVGATVLLLTLPLIRQLVFAAKIRAVERARRTQTPLPTLNPNLYRGFRWLIHDPYVRGIALLVYVMFFTGTLLDFEYNKAVEHWVVGKEEKTAYFGKLYGWNNVISFAIQILVTGVVHRKWGPRGGLVILPTLTACAVSVLYMLGMTHPNGQWGHHQVFSLMTWLWIMGLGVTYSINQASKELLYSPTDQSVKYGAKAYIDVFIFRLGDSSAAVLMLILSHTLHLTLPWVAAMVLILVLIWFVAVMRITRRYQARSASVVT